MAARAIAGTMTCIIVIYYIEYKNYGVRKFSDTIGGFVSHKTYTCSPDAFRHRLPCVPQDRTNVFPHKQADSSEKKAYAPSSRFNHTVITGSGMIT